MPLPTNAELPTIYPSDTPGVRNDSHTALWECRKKGIGPDLSALALRALIQYARKRGLTDLEQISDEFIAEWRRPHPETLKPPGYCYECRSADLCPACRNDMIS
jgi:hypothetical protein